jgi:anti-sigma28 factor (negative regulator of flagellin synthesis)
MGRTIALRRAYMKVARSSTNTGTSNSMHGTQLSKLSSVLNGLEQGASAMRRQAQQLMRAVRSGTYEVDPLQLSRRIIGDALASA